MILSVLGVVDEWLRQLNGDAAWLVYTARRVVDGSRLYVDILETNPPLIVWLTVPCVVLSRMTGLSDVTLFRLGVLGTVGASLWISHRLLRCLLAPAESALCRAFLLALLVILVTIPGGGFFGEREHLVLALLGPAILTAVARRRGVRVASTYEWVVGLMAGIAIALKPPFLLLWLGLRLYAHARDSRFFGLPYLSLRSAGREGWAVAAVLLAYALAIPAASPEYLRAVRQLGGLYWSWEKRPYLAILTRGVLPFAVWGALVPWLLARSSNRQRDLLDALGLAMLLGVAAVLVQHKGLGYHFYPAFGFALLLCASATIRPRGELATARRFAGQVSGALIFFVYAAIFIGVMVSRARASALDPGGAPERVLTRFLRGKGSTVNVLVVSSLMPDAFPVVLETGVGWASRHPNIWCVPAAYWEQLARGNGSVRYRSWDEMGAAERWCLRSVVEDLKKYRPALIVVRKPTTDQSGDAGLRIDYLAYFLRYSDFLIEFRNYEREVELGPFVIYRRRGGTSEAGAP